jgi:hypothetical protein
MLPTACRVRAAALPIAATLVVGCGGAGPARPTMIGSVPAADAPAGEAPGATAIAPPGGLVRAFAAMPADYELILALDASKLRASGAYRRHEARLRAELGSQLAQVSKACGFDPLATVTGVLLGGRGGTELDHATIFVNGLEREATNDCLARRIATRRAERPAARWIVDGDFVEYAEDDPEDGLRMRWLGRRSALVIKDGDDAADARALAAAAAAREGAGLSGSPAFMALVAGVRTDAAAWFIIHGSPERPPAALPSLRAIRGAFDADDGVRGEIRLTPAATTDARALAAELDRQLASLKTSPFGHLVAGVAVRADRDDVVLAIALSAEQLDGLLALVGLAP